MILDNIENFDRYTSLHPDFAKIAQLIKDIDFASKPAGRLTFEGESYYINIDEAQLRPANIAYPEVHDAYIDIQIPLSRSEVMGWLPRSECKNLREANPAKDYSFYNELPEVQFEVKPGQFVIFFPEDAHSPIIGEGKTKKAIIKVKV